jgi:PAS domain S-box-containing protein
VLVVEDDPGIAVLQRRGLERAGFRVLTADTLDKAQALMDEHDVSLVVLDYRLPDDRTGLEFHRWMQASGYNVPVIMVTGASDETTAIRAMRAGVRDFVIKSIDYLNYLPDAAKNLLDRADAGGARALAPHPAGVVLVVEDDPGIATLERRRLERAGFRVATATAVGEALERVRRGDVMMAVLDLQLPDERSGLDLYAQLKAEGHNIPAIVVTAFPDESAVVEALRLGVRDFVPKTGEYLDYLPRSVERVVDQLRLEGRIADTERRMATLVATAMDAIVTCDDRHRIVIFNAAAERMFRRRAAEALGRSIHEMIPGLPIASSVPGSGGERAPAKKPPVRWEGEAVRGDGTTVPVEVSLSQSDLDEGRVLTVIARDIAERREAEAALREADRRKDEFLGMLAHELRNPLAAITNASEVLRHLLEADGRAAALNAVVIRQTRALAHMVDDLLDLSRVTLGKIALAKEPLVLSQVVMKAVEGVRRTIDQERHELGVTVDPDPIWLDADATRLEQVIVNLLNNAAKFTPPGGRLQLTARRENGEAVVRVADNGIGISPDLMPHIFERREPETRAVATARRRLRVLVVDDQPDMADCMAVLVQMLGHDARAAYDGRTGLSTALQDHPDLILVDIGMAGMTGYEFARLVRRDPSLASTRLVAVTGYGRPEDRERAREAGFDRHVTKPVAESMLQSVLAETSTSG